MFGIGASLLAIVPFPCGRGCKDMTDALNLKSPPSLQRRMYGPRRAHSPHLPEARCIAGFKHCSWIPAFAGMTAGSSCYLRISRLLSQPQKRGNERISTTVRGSSRTDSLLRTVAETHSHIRLSCPGTDAGCWRSRDRRYQLLCADRTDSSPPYPLEQETHWRDSDPPRGPDP